MRAQRRNQVKFVKLEVSAYRCYLNLWELGKTPEIENANKEKIQGLSPKAKIWRLENKKRERKKRERDTQKRIDKNGRKI